VEAYDLFKAIYQERGYRARDIPSLILQKNLFGLEIDDRAAQLAAFALMMKARADDRRIFASGVKPHVLAIQDSMGLDAQQITEALNVPILKTALLPSDYLFEELEAERAPLFNRKNLSVKGDIAQADVAQLIELFEHGKTFGSLIRVPEELAEKLPAIVERVKDILTNGSLLEKAAAKALIPLIEQARILAGTYNAVVANPPYIGGHGQNPTLKKFLTEQFPDVKSDTFSAFILRNREWASKEGNIGIMCPFVWMFLSSYQRLRASIIDDATLTTLIQLEYSGFDGATVPICTFTMNNTHIPGFVGSFIKLSDFRGAQNQGPKALEAIRNKNCGWFYLARQDDFQKLPGSPLAYWASNHVRSLFASNPPLANAARSAKGLDTCDNDRFMRAWFEVSLKHLSLDSESTEDTKRSGTRWFPYCKGGDFRKWYGNLTFVVDWKDDGQVLKALKTASGKLKSRPQNTELYFRPGITFSALTSAVFSCRIMKNAIFGGGGNALFSKDLLYTIGFLNSKLGLDHGIGHLAFMSPQKNE
jgi:type II restriction/modification system DNA methylase subunit YeeA